MSVNSIYIYYIHILYILYMYNTQICLFWADVSPQTCSTDEEIHNYKVYLKRPSARLNSNKGITRITLRNGGVRLKRITKEVWLIVEAGKETCKQSSQNLAWLWIPSQPSVQAWARWSSCAKTEYKKGIFFWDLFFWVFRNHHLFCQSLQGSI